MNQPPVFIPDLILNRHFYWQAVRLLLDKHFAGAIYHPTPRPHLASIDTEMIWILE